MEQPPADFPHDRLIVPVGALPPNRRLDPAAGVPPEAVGHGQSLRRRVSCWGGSRRQTTRGRRERRTPSARTGPASARSLARALVRRKQSAGRPECRCTRDVVGVCPRDIGRAATGGAGCEEACSTGFCIAQAPAVPYSGRACANPPSSHSAHANARIEEHHLTEIAHLAEIAFAELCRFAP